MSHVEQWTTRFIDMKGFMKKKKRIGWVELQIYAKIQFFRPQNWPKIAKTQNEQLPWQRTM